MAIVYKITISKIEVTKKTDDNYYNLKLDWSLEQNPVANYIGPFWLNVFSDGILEDKILFYGDRQAYIENLILNEAKTYDITMTASERFTTSCNKVRLLLDTYENVEAVFESNILTIGWSEQNGDINSGLLSLSPIKCSFGNNVIREDSRYIKTIICPEEFMREEVLKTCLIPCWEGISYGIPSDHMEIYIEPLHLIAVEKIERGVKVIYTLPDRAYTDKEEIQVQFLILYNGQERYKTNKMNLIETDETNVFAANIILDSEQLLTELEMCELVGAIGTANAIHNQITIYNGISLKAPKLSVSFEEENKALLTWEYDNTYCSGYQIYADQTPLPELVYGNQYLIENGKEYINKKLTVVPIVGQIKGPVSNEVVLFQKAYYDIADQNGHRIYYNQNSYGERMTRVLLPTSVFDPVLKMKITTDFFTISSSVEGYVLEIDRTKAVSESQYETILMMLFDKGLTIEGYYKLRNVLARILSSDLEQSLFYYCSMNKNSYMADLMPGMILVTETAAYQKQNAAVNDDRNGYIKNGVSEYPISLSGNGSSSVLEFDSFIGQIAGNFGSGNQGTYRHNYAGLTDFFHSNVRKPFYKIVYPVSFLDSSNPGTSYPSDNITLIAASKYSDIKEIDTATVNDLLLPHIIFRGRSSATIKITVFVNQMPVTVGIGTTLCKLLEQYAVLLPIERVKMGKIRLLRETGLENGEMAEVIFRWLEDDSLLYKIPLLPGDRIEV